MVNSVHSVHKRMQIVSKVCKSLQLCAHFSPNILDTSQPLREVSAVLEIGRLHSHDPWAGGGAAGLVNWSMSRHAFQHLSPSEMLPEVLRRRCAHLKNYLKSCVVAARRSFETQEATCGRRV